MSEKLACLQGGTYPASNHCVSCALLSRNNFPCHISAKIFQRFWLALGCWANCSPGEMALKILPTRIRQRSRNNVIWQKQNLTCVALAVLCAASLFEFQICCFKQEIITERASYVRVRHDYCNPPCLNDFLVICHLHGGLLGEWNA